MPTLATTLLLGSIYAYAGDDANSDQDQGWDSEGADQGYYHLVGDTDQSQSDEDDNDMGSW